ncbi:hypothetical protein SAMN05428985_104417 [Nocardioides sp. YR527]|uniref:hypothetical protein n=1 Tax=Nocardioides sp. YR527 TaxID=1881028 RepID=UPI00088EED7B|nr:hypothetical protein [Nocardioides sp. YR527]SDK53918.1 hypothetical protein SAMN05428985_104417 [Nocardioides sp. YR527]
MSGPGDGASVEMPAWRRTTGVLAGLTAAAATVGSVQLLTGTFTPPVSDLRPLGLDSWALPGLALAASVAVPCAATAVLSWRRSRWMGPAAIGAGSLLAVELMVQLPFVGRDPLQGVMAVVAASLVGIGWSSARRSGMTGRPAPS